MRPRLTLLLLLTCRVLHAQEWPQWRGPDGQGHATATNLPATWTETEHIAWRTQLPGRAWSSPVIEGNLIWLTTAIEREASPEDVQRRSRENTGGQPLTMCEHVSFRALGVHKTSGELVHDIELMGSPEPQWVHRLNSYASPTPVLDQGKLYAHFGTFGTVCLDTHTRQVLWRNRSLEIMHENGPGSSPVLWRDHLIFHMDGSDEQYIVALNKNTGDVAWKTARSGAMGENPQVRKAYGTPLIVQTSDQPQLISPAADWLYSYDPSNGRELWKLSYGAQGFSIVPRPVAGHGFVYMCTSFMRSELLAVRLESNEPEIAWRYGKGVPQTPSPILVGNEIYFVADSGGLVTCLDARTGQEHWRERIGGNYSAAPLYADGKLFFFSREGVTSVLKPGSAFTLLAQNTLDGSLMASAAAVDQALFLRTDTALYRIGK